MNLSATSPRRAMMLGAAALLTPLLAPQAALARRPVSEPRRLSLRFAHTGERFSGVFHNGRGHDARAISEVSRVVRDYRTGAVRPVDPALLDLLWRLGQETGTPSFEVLSGYRTPETNARVGGVEDSQHLEARALDLWFPADELPALAERAVSYRSGGVGLYDGFLHLDTGPVRRWDFRRGARGGAPPLRSPAPSPSPASPAPPENPHRIPLPALRRRPARPAAPAPASPGAAAIPISEMVIFDAP